MADLNIESVADYFYTNKLSDGKIFRFLFTIPL